jgi:hypothetical protein
MYDEYHLKIDKIGEHYIVRLEHTSGSILKAIYHSKEEATEEILKFVSEKLYYRLKKG